MTTQQQPFTADDIFGIKSITDLADSDVRLVYLGSRRKQGFPGTWCKPDEHTDALDPEPATPAGGEGDLLAVSCTTDRSRLPSPGSLVVLSQHGLYTHLGALRSSRWLRLQRPGNQFKYFVWVEILAIRTSPAGLERQLQGQKQGSRPPWFKRGGGSRFWEIDARPPAEIGPTADFRKALWDRFFPGGMQPPEGKVAGIADRSAVRA